MRYSPGPSARTAALYGDWYAHGYEYEYGYTQRRWPWSVVAPILALVSAGLWALAIAIVRILLGI